jgi:hypothetical protein
VIDIVNTGYFGHIQPIIPSRPLVTIEALGVHGPELVPYLGIHEVLCLSKFGHRISWPIWVYKL